MDCHLFCHNELPTALAMLPFAGAALAYARTRLRAWRRR